MSLDLLKNILLNNAGLAVSLVLTASMFCQEPDASDSVIRLSLPSWMLNLPRRSVLIGVWFVAYLLLVRFVMANKSGRLRQWVKDVQSTTNSTMIRVSSNEAVNRIRTSAAATSCARLLNLAGCGRGPEDRTLIISAAESFLSVEIISSLSLLELKDLFYYARHVNSDAFERQQFINALPPPARLAVYALDEVTAASRGGIPLPNAQTEMDALYYTAVLRIFAEWRSVRLVPKGSSQRYAFGMGVARRDLLQNITKVEDAAHQWLLFHECSVHQWKHTEESTIPRVESPTIRQLLERELQMNIHARLPCLAEASAASGVLWSKRQLQYQTSLLAFVIQVPFMFPDSKAAVLAAYKSTYDKYHGFFVRKIFQGSFEAAPPADEILHSIRSDSPCDDGDDAQTEDLTDIDSESDESSWVQLPVDGPAHGEEANPAPPPLIVKLEQRSPFDHIVQEATKFISQCIGQANLSPSMKANALRSLTNAEDSCRHTVVKHRPDTNTADIRAFISIAQPLLDEIDGLIARLNMNDPTKV